MDFDLPADPEDENFDWLDGLQSGDEDAAGDLVGDVSFDPYNPDEEIPAPEESPDWLASIREAEGTVEIPSFGAEGEEAAEGGDPDWLDNIRAQHVEETDEEPAGEPEGSFLDRIQDMKAEDQSSQAEEVADWLSGIDSGSLPSDIVGEESTDDWLKGLDSGSLPSEALDSGPPEEEPTADWLSGLGDSQPESAGEPSEFLSEFGGDQEPSAGGQMDWLTELEGDAPETPTEVPEFFADTPGEADDDTGSPEWFADFGDEETEHEDGTDEWFAEVAAEAAADEAGPDWLEDLGGQDEPEPGATAAPVGEKLPDWLQGVADDAASAPASFIPEPEEETQFPDWEGGPSIDASAGVDEEFPDLPGEPGEAGMPSWLEELQDGAPDLAMPGGVPAFEELTDITAFTPDDDPSSILEPTSLPDWLTQAAPSALMEDGAEGEGLEEGVPVIEAPSPIDTPVEDGEIAPGELPSWLQAMRPVEAVAPPVEEVVREAPTGEAETIGPLAGLRGILPAEPGIVHFGKSPLPITDVSSTPSQQNYTKLLQAMVLSEEEAPPARRRALALPQQILRWLIAIVLYLTVFAYVFLGSTDISMPAPDAAPLETRKTFETINSLSPGDAVLVAFEYQPGLSGELAAASAGVLTHLIGKNAHLMLFSTQPTGPGLARNLLKEHNVPSESYSDLGYLSGGGAALLSFATDPRNAFPAQTGLVSISSINDFQMVLVITDDPDTARSWVEQVQPTLAQASTPLLMVVSAQAEPMVQPYYQNSQINGMVGGLSGGAAYESLINQPDQAKVALSYWDTYSTGLTISVVLISLGGLVNYIRALLSARRKGTS